MSLRIALDYDDTWTADKKLWATFILDAYAKGHRVYCVTARRNTPENLAEIMADFTEYGIDSIICGPCFSNLKPKKDLMIARGIEIDIWIDDNPDAIINGIK